MVKQIIIKKIRLPAPGNIEDDIDFISKSFGYFTQRDTANTAGRIFRILVKDACGDKEGLSSEEISEKLDISRGTTVYHLNSFIETGLISKEHNKYRLRSPSLQKSIEEIKEDMERMMKHMLKIALEIDKQLGHYYR